MRLWIVTIMGCGMLALSIAGCASIPDLRYPLPEPSGPKWQLNPKLWQWNGPDLAESFGRNKT
jgi:hypothetical protein